MTTDASASVSAELLGLAATGRPRPAIDLALGLLADGVSVDQMITGTLAGVQREVGRLWQANQWTVAQEHAATAVIDGVLGAVSLQTNNIAVPKRGSVLIACVEEEYHSLPARMGGERLHSDGWDVTFLGASVPAHDLQQYVVDTEPDRIVLSCTLSLHLPGAARGIAALADLGAAVTVAGAAFGDTPDRAHRLGASAWIGPHSDPSAVLEAPMSPARAVRVDNPESHQLAIRLPELVEASMEAISSVPSTRDSHSVQQLSLTREDVDHILRHLALAIGLGDSQVFHEFVTWLAEVRSSRTVPRVVLTSCLRIISDVLHAEGYEQSSELCRTLPPASHFTR